MRCHVVGIATLAACYAPAAPAGAPCSSLGDCPDGQHCDAPSNRCVVDGSAPIDAAIADDAPPPPIDAPAAPVTELFEPFDGAELSASWQVVAAGGTWSVSRGAVAVVSPGPEADYVAYPLQSTGSYRATMVVTIDRLRGAAAADHLIGVALQGFPDLLTTAGAACALSRQGSEEGLLMFDLSDASDQANLAIRPFTLTVGMTYTLVITRVVTSVDTYACSAESIGATTPDHAASTAPVSGQLFLTMLASGIDARIDSVTVERLP